MTSPSPRRDLATLAAVMSACMLGAAATVAATAASPAPDKTAPAGSDPAKTDPARPDPAAKPVTLLVAHRGASFDAPENTVAALKLGFEQGAEYGELDVWISKDGRAVLHHDATTRRTAGVDGKVADRSLAELRTLDVGSFGKFKGGKFAGERMATLEEALATVPAGRGMFVEIKCGTEGVAATLRAIKDAGLPPAATPVICFNRDVLVAVKKARPDLPVYWLVSLRNREGKTADTDDIIAKTKAAGFEGLDVADSAALDAAFVAKVRAAGLKMFVWTVDDAAAARRLVALGVDGITTNKPAFLRRELGLPAPAVPTPATKP